MNFQIMNGTVFIKDRGGRRYRSVNFESIDRMDDLVNHFKHVFFLKLLNKDLYLSIIFNETNNSTNKAIDRAVKK